MIRQENYLGHEVGAIYVQGLRNEEGDGYFQAFVETMGNDGGETQKRIIRSKSKKGLFVACTNLCKRLDKAMNYTFDELPSKWQIYIVNPETLMQYSYLVGYITLSARDDGALFWADMYTYTFMMDSPSEDPDEQKSVMEQFIREGFLNSVEDSSGQTGFGALANLFTKFRYLGIAHTINSLVLDSLTASFFLPASLEGE